MSSASTAKQNINTQLVLLGFIAMTIAFAFVAFITNMIVNSKVNAFAANVSTQLAANQNNPVTVGTPAQSNSLGGCTSPADAAAATSAAAGTGTDAQTNVLPWASKPGKFAFALGNYSQSNSSVTNVTSNNTYVKDSYNTSRSTNILVTNNGNDYSDHRNSGNTTTTNTDNSNNSTNVNIQNSGNTTTTNTDNSNNSVNTNIQDFSNNSVNNSGNTTTTNTDNSVNTNVAALVIL
jgi:hypothetical protein